MPDAFFVSSKTRKRKRSATSRAHGSGANASKKPAVNGKGRPGASAPSKRAQRRDREELESDATQEDNFGGIDDLELRASDVDHAASGEEDDAETPAEKRLRLARLYLDSVKEGLADGEFDAAEIDKEIISSRLKQDVLEGSGKLHRFIADTLDFSSSPPSVRLRRHKHPITSAVATPDAHFLFCAAKDGSISQWDLRKNMPLQYARKIRPDTSDDATPSKANRKGKGKEKAWAAGINVQGHTDEVLALAVSEDGRYLVSGGKDRKVVVWDAEKLEWVKNFGGHKDLISGLAFRRGTLQLYSGSFDRTIKLFDLGAMGYVETLFGHQDTVTAVDAARAETAVSAGARDRTVRFWKVADETQLVFRGGGKSKVREVLEGGLDGLEEEGEEGEGKRGGEQRRFVEGSIDCVAMVDESTFVSGGDSGSLCVWMTQKKKPQFTQPLAHGTHEVHSETEGIVVTPRWITALACLPYGDVVASGSWSGDIRLWKLDPKSRSVTRIGSLPVEGIVNSLQLLAVPSSTVHTFSWVSKSSQTTNSTDAHSEPNGIAPRTGPRSGRAGKVEALLVVAGMGQEPRLGRWLKVGGGKANGTKVLAVLPRTTGTS